MIWYSFKLFIRRVLSDKTFSLINVVGLTVGITSFFVLFLHVMNEKSFDTHFEGYQNIYRVSSSPVGQGFKDWARSLGMVHKAAATLPEIEVATQFSHTPVGTITIDGQAIQQEDVLSVDQAFMDLFMVESVVGDLTEINKPNTAFVSEAFAQKYFPDENPIGKILEVDALQYMRDLGAYEIRGVVRNTHPKTHFNYHVLLSQKGALSERYAALPELKIHWTYNYIKLKEHAAPSTVVAKLLDYFNASSLKETRGPKDYRFGLIPLADIHLKSDYRFELKESSSKINIGLFVLIASVILLTSLLNFINLTLAKLIKRSKELGLKKSLGANVTQLIRQVLVEVFFFCGLSMVLALILAESIRPAINRIFDIDFRVYYSEPVVYVVMGLVVALCLGLTAIFSYFFLLKKTSTIDILWERTNFSGSVVLKSLLIGQVSIVILLLCGTVLVNKQMNFIANQSLGFDQENVVVVKVSDFSKDPAVFASELEKLSSVAAVGFTSQHFGYPTQSINLEGLGIDGSAEFVFANYDYLKTMNIQLTENWINPAADTVRGMVINEHLYHRLIERHGSLDALHAYQQTQPLEADQERISFIGVAKDFNYNSVHQPIGDFAFWLDESARRARFTHVRLSPGNLQTAMNDVKQVWQQLYPEQEFSYFFMDEQIAQQYKAEVILSRILLSFSILGVLISIIGISALSLFIAQQRTKEIGIRKVNGATIFEILTLLNKDFIRWVAIAFVIACPIAWYAMSRWLENFAYKTTLSWWIFALAGLLALGIALLTVSWQSWRAATRNPVEALRYE
ncbi:ABC transporter permease [uncultured Sunxiuqinia sp.]|uniref:ABC transporter permease n=1 Tax=uncultured Sunxiuqinia sp. TaxID=1573825 RepID=UPI002635F597|nr:ABC transporter permease [uncultured Sunxiuqinia sp.]